MKTIFVAVLTMLGTVATACPSLSGNYIDRAGFKYVVAMAPDCHSMTWTTQYESPPATPDPRFPKTSTVYFDVNDRETPLGNDLTFFVNGTLQSSSVVLNQRMEDSAGNVVQRSQITYSARYTSLSQLVEEGVYVNPDGTTSPWFTKIYTKVH